MAKPSIQNITTTQTFQNWFDKTNEMVAIFRDSALTAQAGTADVTTGNATLVGEFTANELIATVDIQTDAIQSKTPATPVAFASPVTITPVTDSIAVTFAFAASGGRARFTDNTTNWDIGYENSVTSAFQINQGGGGQFSLSPAGVLTVPSLVTSADVTIGTNLTVPGTLTANNILTNTANGAFTGTFTGDVTGDIYHPAGNKVFENGGPAANIPATFTGNVNGTVSSLTNHDTDSLSEGDDNLYFTTARARASLSPGVGVSYDGIDGVITIGQDVGTNDDVTFNDVDVDGDLTVAGDATVTGTVDADKFTGDGSELTGIVQLVKAYISFNGTNGTVLSSGGGLTLTKTATGTYTVNIPSNIPGGRPSSNTNYAIIIGNVDDKQTNVTASTARDANGVTQAFTNYNAWVSSQTTSSFVIKATRTIIDYQHFGGNDNNTGATFGITTVDPTLINIAILY